MAELRFVTVHQPPVTDLQGKRYYYDKNWQPTRRRPPPVFAGKPAVVWDKSATHLPIGRFGQNLGIRKRLINILGGVAKDAGLTVVPHRQSQVLLSNEGIPTIFGGIPTPQPATVSRALIDYHAAQILAGVTLFREWHDAWIAGPLPAKNSDSLYVRFGKNPNGTTQQLRSLLLAATNGRGARLEIQWRETTPAARFVLKRSLDAVTGVALEKLAAFRTAAGDIISTPVPHREFLVAILPRAIELASRRHGAIFDREGELLLTCRSAFLAVRGGHRDLMSVGCIPHPHGKGAEFVRNVEELFNIDILADNSHHMIKRVRATSKLHKSRW